MRSTTVPARLGTILLAAALVALPAGGARAQTRAPASITGTVRSEGQQPLGDVEVRVAGEAYAGRTSPNGVYTVDSIPGGQYIVQVRRLGYRPLYFAVTLKAGERREVDVELSALPQRLSAVQVKERSGFGLRDANKLRDFEWRRKATATTARFLTRDDLARRHRGAGTLFNAIRTEHPLSACAARAASAVPGWDFTSLAGSRACRVAVSIDGGIPMDGAMAADYPLDMVEAVEIYRNGIGAPIEFQNGAGRSASVIVVVWTGVDTDW